MPIPFFQVDNHYTTCTSIYHYMLDNFFVEQESRSPVIWAHIHFVPGLNIQFTGFLKLFFLLILKIHFILLNFCWIFNFFYWIFTIGRWIRRGCFLTSRKINLHCKRNEKKYFYESIKIYLIQQLWHFFSARLKVLNHLNYN